MIDRKGYDNNEGVLTLQIGALGRALLICVAPLPKKEGVPPQRQGAFYVRRLHPMLAIYTYDDAYM